MDENISAAPEPTLRRLRALRRGLLHVHKALLDLERADYERIYGRVASGELLQLVISHEQFAWLHALSELIVGIDEILDADEPPTISGAESALAQARRLLKPSEAGGDFERRYHAALQRDPATALAHGEVTLILSAGS